MKVPILGVKIDSLNKKQVLKNIEHFFYSNKQHYLATVNPEFIMQSQKDDFFRYILNNADIATADGFGIILASHILGMPLKNRITGVDLIYDIAKLCGKKNKSIFFLGGSKGSAEKTADKLKKMYPNLKIGGADSSINIQNIKYLEQKIFNKISIAKPDVLLVALGAPKQEKFIYYNLDKFPTVKLAIGVGGAFDFISGKIKRAPLFMQKIGLEWLYRLIKEPWRIKRIYRAAIRFPLTSLKWRIRIIFCYRKNVVTAIINKKNRILLVQRANEPNVHWQFVQGGVERGESLEKAVLREASEELGTNKLQIIKKLKTENTYLWPKWHQLIKGYKGQKQKVFLLRYLGSDKDFNFNKSKEISDFMWVNKKQAIKTVHQVRRELIKKIVQEI